MKSLENKVAIVRKGGSGFGKAIALLYASHGAKIIVSDNDEAAGRETVSQIKASGGDAIYIKTESSNLAYNKSLVERIAKDNHSAHITCW